MKRMQKGFTLIELMIVVAIIGILAAVAIPQYQDYTVKAKLSKSASYVAPFKSAIAVFMQEHGGPAAFTAADNWTSLGMGSPSYTPEVTNISVAATTMAIQITLAGIKTGIDGSTVTFTPTQGASAVTWSVACSNQDPVVKNFYKC